jgi:hydrogenase maturation protease
MAAERTPLLVLGLGNLLFGDDGLGVAAAEMLCRDYETPAGAQVLDGGTLGLALLPLFQSAERVILIDAVRAEAPSGSLVRIEGEDVAPAARERLSPHQVGVTDVLEAARWLGCYPERLVLLGLVPGNLGFGLSRSPAVERRLDELVKRVVEQASDWGYAFRPRKRVEPPARGAVGDGVGIARLRQ